MKILLLNLYGTILLVALAPPGRGALSNRLAALRSWPARRNRPRYP
jgi:hypothetical protein